MYINLNVEQNVILLNADLVKSFYQFAREEDTNIIIIINACSLNIYNN